MGKQVLVVSDDQKLARVIKHLLQRSGLQARVCVTDSPSSVTCSESLVQDKRFDLLVVAISFYEHDPIFWVINCPVINQVREIPWLVISNRPFADNPQREIAYLPFPFDIIEFWRKVEELLEPGSNGVGILRFLEVGWKPRPDQNLEARILVLLASNNDLFRREFSQSLNCQNRLSIVDEARTGLEAGIKALSLTPDIMIIDRNMPAFDIKIVNWVRERSPKTTVVLLTMNDNQNKTVSSAKLEERLYDLQGTNLAQLVEAVQVLS